MPPPVRFDLGDHACAYCGARHAPYGFDGRLLEGRLPMWACHEHTAEVREMAGIRKTQRLQAKVDEQVTVARMQKAATPQSKRGPDQRQLRLFG